jgi:hypothetical protein
MPMTARFRALTPQDVERARADSTYLEKIPREPALVLGRTWHALHYLLCNDPWDGPEPVNHAILGGTPLVDDLGPRILGPELVARVARALLPINIPAIVADFQPDEFERLDIYPGGWHERASEWPELLAADLAVLRQFYQERAAAGDAVLIHLNTNP